MLTMLARTTKARALYRANNETLALMRRELRSAVDSVFRQVPRISVRVMPDQLYLGEESVYQDPESAESLPFVLYRDGIRRLDLMEGISDRELDVLMLAIRRGQQARTMEDDVVAQLWRHQLEHVRYVAVDVQVTDAAAEREVDEHIDGMLRQLFRRSSRGAHFNLNLDEQEEAAKAIGDALLDVKRVGPGLAPLDTLPTLPSYGERMLDGEVEEGIFLRFVAETVSVLEDEPDLDEAEYAFGALLNLLDATLLTHDLALATRIVEGVRRIRTHGRDVQNWLDQALTDARLRQVVGMCDESPEHEDAVHGFFRAAGRRSVPSLIRSLATISHPEVRRGLSDLILELGVEDVTQLRELVENEQGFAAREGLYLLAQTDHLRDRRLLREIQRHPRPQVRLALINEIDRVPADIAPSVLAELLREDDAPRVRVAAAETLAQRQDPTSIQAIEHAVERPAFEDEPESVKRAVVLALLSVQGAQAVWRLQAFIAKSDMWRPKRGHEELALAAVQGLGQLRHQSAIDALKAASLSRCKPVRTQAKAELERIKREQ